MTTQVPAGTPAPEEVEVPKTLDERMDAVESVMLELIDRVEKLTQSTEAFKKTAVTKPKGLFGGKREPTPMKDIAKAVRKYLPDARIEFEPPATITDEPPKGGLPGRASMKRAKDDLGFSLMPLEESVLLHINDARLEAGLKPIKG